MHGASSPHFKLSWPVFPASAVRKLDFYNPVTSFAYSTLFFLVDLFHLFAHAFWSEHFNTPCRCLYQIWLWGFLLRFLCVFFQIIILTKWVLFVWSFHGSCNSFLMIVISYWCNTVWNVKIVCFLLLGTKWSCPELRQFHTETWDVLWSTQGSFKEKICELALTFSVDK